MAHAAHPFALAGYPTAPHAAPAAGRLPWVDVGKGIGILLVVYGHATGGLISARLLSGDGLAAASFYAIYTFHMPLFFFLSGLFVPKRIARDRLGFTVNLLKTIVYPYLLWSVVQVTVLHLASGYVNRPREHFDYASILWAPPSQFWFLYVLGLYHLSAIALVHGARGRLALVGLGSVTLVLADVVPLPTTFLTPWAHNLLFYALGLVCGGNSAAVARALARHGRLLGWGGVLAFAATVALGISRAVSYDSVAMLPAAIGGSLGVIALATCFDGRGRALFGAIGQRAMAIFVAHVLFVAGMRIVLAKLLGVQNGALLLPILVAAGLIGPLALVTAAARLGWSERLGLGKPPRLASSAPRARPTGSERALFVSHSAQLGGAELFLIDLVTANADWDACFLASGPAIDRVRAAGREPYVVPGAERLFQVRRASGPLALCRAGLGVVHAARGVARLARNRDLICANSMKALVVCALASMMARRPLVWIVHDILTDASFSRANRLVAVACANQFARRVIANSRETARAFIAGGGRASAVTVIYNGFDPARHKVHDAEAGAALRERFGLDGRPVVALFGRLCPWKGQRVFVEAMAAMPGVQALLVGGALFGEEQYAADLAEMIARGKLGGRVRLLGFRDDVPDLMAGVDVVVHCSIQPEPFGRVIVEAMLAARPVVAAAAGGVTEIVRDGFDGLLVPPGDPAALRTAIARLLADPEEAKRLAGQGRASAIARYDLDRSRAALAEVFRDLGTGQGRRPRQDAGSGPAVPATERS